MVFSINKEQTQLRNQIITFVKKELNDDILKRDREQLFNRQHWLKCGELRLQGLPVPEEYGGAELDPLSTAIALEAFGYGCNDGGLVFAICAHLLSCVVPIWKHGNDKQKNRYLPDLCNGNIIGANATTESNSGSDVFSMSTKAVNDGDGFCINGTKTFSSNGPVADLILVYAVTDSKKGYHGGITAFLVDKESPGIHIGQKYEKMGLRTSLMSELIFENAYLPSDAVLGKVGAGAMIFSQSMDWERICLVASHVGTMERLLEKAINFARTRHAYNKPISEFQAISHKIADMKVRLEAARLLTYKAASRLDTARDVSMDASITKLFASESLVKTALDTIQIFGGYGFMTEYEVERALRDAVGSTIYSGTSEIQRNIIARWLGL